MPNPKQLAAMLVSLISEQNDNGEFKLKQLSSKDAVDLVAGELEVLIGMGFFASQEAKKPKPKQWFEYD